MDLQDKNKWGLKRLFRSFLFAWSGVSYVWKHEQNFRIHVLLGAAVIVLGWFLSVPIIQMLILIIVIGIVLSLEVMNTAIEKTVDLITEEFHPVAKVAKDIAAAAVFVFAMIAVLAGMIIFLPLLLMVMGMIL